MKKRFLLFTFFLFSILLNAQDELKRAISNLEKNYTQEKIYILYDKNEYVSGDQIFFKAFIFNGYKLSKISTTLFIELYNSNKVLIDRKTLPIDNGNSHGNFSLKNELDEGIYYVRAYTPLMSNFDSQFNYIEPILIYNPSSKLKLKKDTRETNWDISAIPESNILIDNIDTKIAVRLKSTLTPPKDWNAYLIDIEKPNEKLINIKNIDENVTVFNFKPKLNVSYQVVVEDINGNKKNTNLPIVQNSGIILTTKNEIDGIHYTLKSIGIKESLQNFKILSLVNNQLVKQINIETNENETNGIIPLNINEGNNGVLQIIVIDQHNKLITSRLCFLNPKPNQSEQPKFSNINLDTTRRAKNTIDILTDNKYSNLTVLVKDENTFNDYNEKNILSALWLTEDFKSNIYSAAKYFKNNTTIAALDAILISEQWNRYQWDNILNGIEPKIKYKTQPYLNYKGKLSQNNRPASNTLLNIVMSNNEDSSIEQIRTDNNGEFFLNNMNFTESLNINYFINSQPKESNADNLILKFTPLIEATPFIGDFPATPYVLVGTEENNANSPGKHIERAILTNKNFSSTNEILIKEININVVKESLKQELNKKLSTTQFNDLNEIIFDFVNENQAANTYNNILLWLNGRVAGLSVLMIRGSIDLKIRGGSVNLFIDESRVDVNAISSLPINDIAMIKVIKSGSILSNAIAIYTKRGNTLPSNPKGKLSQNNKIKLDGYSKSSPFTQIDYTIGTFKNLETDLREVLYWNPLLSKNKSNISKIKFYNNDDSKKNKITVISFGKDDEILYYNGYIH